VHGLVGGEPGARQRIADGVRIVDEFAERNARERLARGEALRGLGEKRSEIQARREIEKVGGWRSDCATTQ